MWYIVRSVGLVRFHRLPVDWLLWMISQMQNILLVVQSLSRVQLFEIPWTVAHRSSLSFTISGVRSNSCPLSQWCHPTMWSSVASFSSCPQPSPALGTFSVSRLFATGGQNIGAPVSASVLPMGIQGWFPLYLAGLIYKESWVQKNWCFWTVVLEPTKTYCAVHGTLLKVMWQPGWEGDLGENGYMYMDGWVPSLFTWNSHNIVNQLFPQYKIESLKKSLWSKHQHWKLGVLTVHT